MFEIPPIPDKLFFRIGEVSEMLGVEPYVLRYWESEFPGLAPKKSSSGQRMFRRKDVDLLFSIKHLLYEKKFTIEGARRALQDQPGKDQPRKSAPARQDSLFGGDPLPEIRKELADLIKLLS